MDHLDVHGPFGGAGMDDDKFSEMDNGRWNGWTGEIWAENGVSDIDKRLSPRLSYIL